jgi:hypothetical protein
MRIVRDLLLIGYLPRYSSRVGRYEDIHGRGSWGSVNVEGRENANVKASKGSLIEIKSKIHL